MAGSEQTKQHHGRAAWHRVKLHFSHAGKHASTVDIFSRNGRKSEIADMHDTSSTHDHRETSGRWSKSWDKRPSLPNGSIDDTNNRSASMFAQRVALPEHSADSAHGGAGSSGSRRRNSALFSIPIAKHISHAAPEDDDELVAVDGVDSQAIPSSSSRFLRSRPSFRQRFWSRRGANVFDDESTSPADDGTPKAAWVPAHAAKDFARSAGNPTRANGASALVEEQLPQQSRQKRQSYDSRCSHGSHVDVILEDKNEDQGEGAESSEKPDGVSQVRKDTEDLHICPKESSHATPTSPRQPAPPPSAADASPSQAELPGPGDMALFVTQAQTAERPKRAAAWAALMELQKQQQKQDEEQRQLACAAAAAAAAADGQASSSKATVTVAAMDSAYCSGASRDSVTESSPRRESLPESSSQHRRDSLPTTWRETLGQRIVEYIRPARESTTGDYEQWSAQERWGRTRSRSTAV